ncbi:2'-5' RNA ligase family protein [Cellulomonas sp. ACRRI]|uniref:2'-5' RNA ligase family protein n=1 Tax=Cellulomonas sp. ACRRI TaxID=2918188 RepID=UPI001EF1C583|nr:2'-5' RNA ligase family protein [Cellulomonas sp. ACRRI]MCG7286405.1 2'-5' RNA ligase family protein [Cellulomonas sp. ACRRI]
MTEPVYGVFLIPDPATSAAVTSITLSVERQFGFVSAGRFPPHATLAGSVPIRADVPDIVAALDPVLRDRPGFAVHHSGIVRHGAAVTYDVDRLPDGTRNLALADLAADVNAALAPLAHAIDALLVSPFRPGLFRAHISLASHEMNTQPDLADQVEAFVRAVPAPAVPASFPATLVGLYEFRSAGWTGHWWETLTWRHLRTWRLADPRR